MADSKKGTRPRCSRRVGGCPGPKNKTPRPAGRGVPHPLTSRGLILANREQYQGAGFFRLNPGRLRAPLQLRVFGAGVKQDALGFQA